MFTSLKRFIDCYRAEIIERVEGALIILGAAFVVFLCTQFMWLAAVIAVVVAAAGVHVALELMREGKDG